MESPEEMTFPVHFLPGAVLDILAEYLNVEDLIACCSTSHGMRYVFNDDLIWKRRCNKDIAEYLKTAPCRIEPPFVSPNMEDCRMHPMSQWRVALMRENHLWNNWRQGKKVEEEIVNQNSNKSKYDCIFHMFFNNDTVIALFRDKIEIVDVTAYPGKDRTEPICSLVNFNNDFKPIAGDKMLIGLYHSGVYVYHINLDRHQCHLKYFFFFEESQKKQVEKTEEVKKIFDAREVHYIRVRHTTFGKFFVGILEGESTMHIWNLERGAKLKEEKCPFKTGSIVDIKSTDRNKVVLLIRDSNGSVFTFLAYSLETFAYLPFREQFEDQPQYIVHEDCVAIVHNNLLNVYNFETATLLLKDEIIHSDPQVLRKSFIFIQEGVLKVFSSSTRVLKCLPLEGVDWFEVLSDRFIQTENDSNLKIWEIGTTFENVTQTSMNLNFRTCRFFFNQAFTRYIVRNASGSVIHFW